MLQILLCLLIPFLLLVYNWIWVPLRLQADFRSKGVKGPNYRPIFGNTVEIQRSYAASDSRRLSSSDHDVLHILLPFYTQWSLKYGKTFLFWFGRQPRLAISDPDIVKHLLLNTGASYVDIRPWTSATLALFGQGLVALRGAEWSLHRRIISPAFHIERVKGWVTEIAAITAKMLEKWEIMREGEEMLEIEVGEQFQTLSGDVIARAAFGSSYEEGKKVFDLQQKLMLHVTRSLRSLHIPGYKFLPTRTNREVWKIGKEINKQLRSLMAEKKGSNVTNLLALMMAEDQLKEEDVMDECKTFFVAGKETTANLMSWVFFCLAVHQDWQEIAREEAFRVLPSSDLPSGEIVSDLKIVGMVINETLRLYPPAVMLLRRAMADLTLGELHVPAGTEFYLPLAALQRDPALWGDDANCFNPGRFSQPRQHLAAFVPFSLGPRICVGQNLAIVETKIVLAMILKRYSFVISPTYVHAPLPSLTVRPAYGMHIVFRKLP